MRGERDAARALERLSTGFAVLVAISGALIVLGALVRAHHAGLACPDWPLCFGEFVPRMDLRVAFEWSHRLLAGSVALLYGVLTLASWRQPELHDSTRRLILLGALLLGVQILLGALTVWELLAAWTVTSHLVIGNGFALVVLLIALSLRESARPPTDRRPPARAAHGLLLIGALLLLLQLVLGGLVSSRYAGLACPEWPTCSGGLWFPAWTGGVGLQLFHRITGYVLALVLAAAALACRHAARLRTLAAAIAGAAFLQVCVGVANVLFRLPVEITALHSALACALVLSLAAANREALLASRATPSGAPPGEPC